MNAIGMPAAFLVSLLLGRIGPAVLGTYALAQILIGVITTFVVYGGPPVLSVFIPKLSSAIELGRFLFTYSVILLGIMMLVLALFWLCPNSFEFLLQSKFDMQNYTWFVALAIVIVVAELLAGAASGLMLIKVSAIARQMMRIVMLPMVAALFVWKREILIDYGLPCILGGFVAGYIAAAAMCAFAILSDMRQVRLQVGFFIPPGFWAFSLSTMMATIFSFIYGNFDRMTVLTIQDVTGLGTYQAVLCLSMLIGLLPQIIGTTLIPIFSSLLASENPFAIHKAYQLLQRMGLLLISILSLFIISYCHELLELFGKSYSSYDYLLSLFSVQSVITSLNFLNAPILAIFQKNLFRLTVNFLQLCLQITLTIMFLPTYGVFAVASAKIFGVVFTSIIYMFYVRDRLPINFPVPSTYKITTALAILCMLIKLYVLPIGWGNSTATFLFFSLFLFTGAKITLQELKDIAVLLFTRKSVLFT
jgi:O-antigen/teichoic acid export membrane protein